MKSWRKTRAYRIWRTHIIRRDKVCQICGSRQHRQAHHIEDGSHHKELRFIESNGVCLCKSCHTQFHTNFKNSFREKCTMKDWLNFNSLVAYLEKVLK